jgi:hypothetical protein
MCLPADKPISIRRCAVGNLATDCIEEWVMALPTLIMARFQQYLTSVNILLQMCGIDQQFKKPFHLDSGVPRTMEGGGGLLSGDYSANTKGYIVPMNVYSEMMRHGRIVKPKT